uniref:Uncharacterized protein n=1 Tax=Romanomermis culicivorax TaxID=13658 RepID=A0A915J6C4_ROMCU
MQQAQARPGEKFRPGCAYRIQDGTSQKLRLKMNARETTSFRNRMVLLRHNKWTRVTLRNISD